MNLRQLRTFIMIAESEGFARAEGRLHLSQPAASRQIQALEAEFGVLLFDRIGRRIQLTSEGNDLLRYARQLLQEADSFGERARALKGGETGTLRVGCSTQHIETVLADFLPHYRRKRPSVSVDLVEAGAARAPEHLERGDIHLALMAAGDDAYLSRPLAPVLVLAVMSPAHRLARRGVLEIAELAHEPLLLLSRDFGSRVWFDMACHIAHIKPRVILESAAPHTLLALARTDLGIAIVPSNVRIFRDLVRVLPLVHHQAPVGRWIVVAWDPRRFLPLYAKQFIDELVVYCGRNYPGLEFVKRTRPLPRPKQAVKPHSRK